MIDKQVKQNVKKLAVTDYIMENMFCAPKGALKRLGEASFVPAPGIESVLKTVYQSISKKAIATAYQESEGIE